MRKIFVLLLLTSLFAKKNPSIGLVLSGGGSKGFAHIEILKALDSLNIPIDYISGTSFGAIVGSMYALGYSGKQIEKMALDTDWYEVQNDEPKRKYLPFFRKKDTGKYQLKLGLDGFKPVVPTGLIYGQKIILDLSKWTREFEQIYDFDLLPIPFRCIAFDIISGKEVIIKEGSLSHALRASLSLPTIFAPVEWEDQLLVDGGIINNLPVDVVKSMGADIVLAIDVTSTITDKSRLKNIYEILDQTLTVHGYEKKNENIKLSDYYIKPQIEEISFTDYQPETIKKLFEMGKNAVEENIDIFKELQKLTSNKKLPPKNKEILNKPIIDKIMIKGNKILSDNFIKSFIILKKGMKLEPSILDDSISELYSLGYFKILYYEIHKSKNDKINIVINVQETSLRNFNLGIKWDNYYDLIAVANVQINSNLLPGLKIENQTQFAGVSKNEFSIYYPSRSLNFPAYPFIRFLNSNLNYKYYSSGNYKGRYKLITDKISTGIGLLLNNYWNAEISYFKKMESFLPEDLEHKKEPIGGIKLTVKLDLLDNILFPENGLYINTKYENGSQEWGSSLNYHIYQGEVDIYMSQKKNTYRVSGYYHQALNDFPKHLITSSKGSKQFTGLKEFQLEGTRLFFSRFEYRYKHKKDIFGHLILSWLISSKSVDTNLDLNNLLCPGIGITLLSPLGPLEFIWSRGPENLYINKKWRTIFYFSAGYKF